MLTLEMGEVIFESHRNDWKHIKHQARYGHKYSLSDDNFEEHHPECVKNSDAYAWLVKRDCEKIIMLAFSTLSETQRRRVEKHIIDRRKITEIADEEGVLWKTVRNSINAACIKMRKFIEKSEYAEYFGGEN